MYMYTDTYPTLEVKFDAVVQQENDRQGRPQCQAVSSDLGVSMMGLTRSGEDSKQMECRGGKSRGAFPGRKKCTRDTDR